MSTSSKGDFPESGKIRLRWMNNTKPWHIHKFGAYCLRSSEDFAKAASLVVKGATTERQVVFRTLLFIVVGSSGDGH
jgi:hypothetical protein